MTKDYPNRSDTQHFAVATTGLPEVLESDSDFAAALDAQYPRYC